MPKATRTAPVTASIERRTGPVRTVLSRATASRVEGEPGKRQRAEDEAESEQRGERAVPLGRELGEKAREEDRHLRVPEVADEALTQRPPWRERNRPRVKLTLGVVVASTRERRPERLRAEEDEVRGAGELERAERGLGRAQDRDQARARGDGPHRLAERDARRRRDATASSTRERVPDRERGVLTRRADDDCRHREECREALEHAGSIARALAPSARAAEVG